MDFLMLIVDFVKLILLLAALFGFLFTIVGFPVGLLFFLIKFSSMNGKSAEEKDNFKKTVLILLFGGILLMLATFLIYSILQFFGVFSGININQLVSQ